MMFEKIKNLKDKYNDSNNSEEKEKIKMELDALNQQNPDEFAEAMILCMKESNKKAEELIIRNKLENILPAISVSYIAKEYFHKSKEWFYQRMNGNIVNGKRVNFTEDEIDTLNFALKDLSKKIGSVSV